MQVVPFPRAPDAKVVALLENVLERARRGEVIAVAIAAHVYGETATDTGQGYELGAGDVAHLVCAIERLKLRLLEHGGR